jgi:hypothetical protein
MHARIRNSSEHLPTADSVSHLVAQAAYDDADLMLWTRSRTKQDDDEDVRES